MNIREKLANGIFEVEAPIVHETVEWDAPEENFFDLKNKPRLDRMLKSSRARAHRRMIREIKQNKHQLGYKGYAE